MPSSRKLVVTPEADADLKSILRYSRATWGEVQRRGYAATVETALERLIDFPEIGKRREEIAVGLRSHAVGEHIVYYRVNDEAIVIRRVLHQRRDVANETGF